MSKRKEVMERLNKTMKSVGVDKFKWIGTQTNLKMYSAFQGSSNVEDFNSWCEESYECDYEDMISLYDVDVKHIGKTSSFYFKNNDSSLETYSVDEFDKLPLERKRLMFFQEFMMDEYGIDIEFSLKDLDWNINEIIGLSEVKWNMINCDEDEEEAIESVFGIVDFNKLSQEFELFCSDELEGINNAYMWLENFKENQVENYKEWLDNKDCECQTYKASEYEKSRNLSK